MRAVVDIFGRQSLSISVDHEEAANHSKSILFLQRFWTGAARRHQILSHALRAFFHVDLSPSIYVDSASRENFTLPALKHAARLAAYFAATIFIGALLAPPLFWAGQWLTARGLFPFLANSDFERFFHRAVLFAAVALLWPLLRLSDVRSMDDLGLAPNSLWRRDLLAGFLLSAIPLLCCGGLFIAFHIYSLRQAIAWTALGKIVAASITVPPIEEIFFRGVVLGLLLKTGYQYMSILTTSAIFSIVHFLKAPDYTSTIVTWTSGLNSIAHSFSQFTDPILLGSAFVTLFVLGLILADARVLTRSLWLPIGLHAGWIFAAGAFNRVAHGGTLDLPWLGPNLLVGIVPLGIAGLTWLIMRNWLKYVGLGKL
jgi:membrane protease YdiL (CAAX protease family)